MFKKDAIENPNEFFEDRFADYRMKKMGEAQKHKPGQMKGPPGPGDKPVKQAAVGKPRAPIDHKTAAVQMFSRQKVGELNEPLAGCDIPDHNPRTETEKQEIAERKKVVAAKKAKMRKLVEGLS